MSLESIYNNFYSSSIGRYPWSNSKRHNRIKYSICNKYTLGENFSIDKRTVVVITSESVHESDDVYDIYSENESDTTDSSSVDSKESILD